MIFRERWQSVLRGCLAVACLALAAGTARAEDVAWQKDLQAAAQKSAQAKKPMLLEFTASWCRYCHKMLRTTFRDEGVVRQVNGCFIPVSVDADRNTKLMKAVGVSVLPTTVIISPELKVVKTITGYQSPEDMRKQLGGLCPHKPGQTRETAAPLPLGTAKMTAADDQPAFHGYCLVSMLDDRKLRKGNRRFTSRYREMTVLFASVEHKRRFNANPEKYWPADDGICPVTRQTTGKKQLGHPKSAVIYQGRLWLFTSPEQRRRFAEDPAKFARGIPGE